MKNLILALVGSTALLASSSSFTQDSKTGFQDFQTPCSDRAYVDTVTKKFGEIPLLRGNSVRRNGEGEDDYKSNVTVLYVNPETKSWTLVEKTDENTYCFISVGAELSPVNMNSGNSSKPKKGKAM